MRRWCAGHRAVAYAVLAFAFSWAWWVPMAVRGEVSRAGQGWPTHLPGLLGPALAAVVVTALADGRRGLADLWSRCIRWRVGWLPWAAVGAVLALLAVPLVVTPGVSGRDFLLYSGAPAVGLLTVLYALVVNGFGEEIGWRGFLAETLLARHGRAVTAVLVWVVWAGWHLPVFWVVENFREFGPADVVGWLVGLLLGSVVLTWLYDIARHSVLLVAAWHTAFNFTTATEATAGLVAAVSSTAVMAVAVVLLCRRSSWQRPVSRPVARPVIGD